MVQLVRAFFRSLPPVAQRDATISSLRAGQDRLRQRLETHKIERRRLSAQLRALNAEVNLLRADLGATVTKPSFRRKHAEAQRRRILVRDEYGMQYPIMTVNSKLDGYRFAASHGIPTPRQIAIYQSAGDIDWALLPDSFVLKAIQGTSARGVMLLERHDEGYIDLLDGTGQ